MFKSSKKFLIIIVLIFLLAGIGVYAVSNYGSESDPLITKSYLDQVIKPQIESELQKQIDSARTNLLNSVPGEYTEIKVLPGHTVSCNEGCQFLICSGSAKSIGILADTTSGGSIGDGTTLSLNHLYMATGTDCGFTAGNGEVSVLLSGSYFAS